MPQLDYVFVDSEMAELVGFLLEEGFGFMPDFQYEEPRPRILESAEEILHYMLDEPKWFLCHESFTAYPLKMSAGLSGSAGPFSIVQRNGGPLIDLWRSGVRTHQGIEFAGRGHIAHYPSFWYEPAEDMIRAPDAQRAAYKRICQFITKHSVPGKAVVGRRRVRIGKQAAAAWREGLQLGWQDLMVRPLK